MNNLELFLKKNSSNILTGIGCIGVVATTILAIKATPKAMELIDEAESEIDGTLTNFEKIQVAWKPYIPTIISGLSTIFCVCGSNYISAKKQKAIISAYMVLDNAYKEYQNHIIDEYGEDTNRRIKNDIMQKQLDNMDEKEMETETLFFEFNTLRFFELSMDKVLKAECKALAQLERYGHLSLNDYYSYLGISLSDYGEVVGWSKYQMDTEQYVDKLEFTYDKTVMSNGLVCYNIVTNIPPTMDYFCF